MRNLILFFILMFPISAFGQDCATSIDVVVESSGDLRANYCANPSDFAGPGNNDPSLRVKPEVGPPKQIRFDNLTTGNFAFVNGNSNTPSNVLRKKNNFDTNVEYTDDVEHEIPSGLFEFKLCLYAGSGSSAEIVSCSKTITSRPPQPSITAEPDIFADFAPSPLDNRNTELFNKQVTVEYSNFQSEDIVEFSLAGEVPDGWVIEANPAETGWEDATSSISYNPNSNGNNSSGSFTVKYRSTVPPFETPQTKSFVANYTIQ